MGNVSTGKADNVKGAILYAPVGTTLPTDAKASVASDFANVGYVSDGGLTNGNERSVNDIKAWGGVIVDTVQTEKKDTFKFRLIECTNVDVLKITHGDSNVTGTESTGITVRENDKELGSYAWVINMILKNDVPKRIVIPNGKVTEVAEVVYNDTDAIGYDVTILAKPDASIDNDTHREYIG